MYKIPKEITEIARKLRKNSTSTEELLWERIRAWKTWYKFIRQHPIYVFTEDTGLNRFIISDVYCKEFKLIIELDGSIHDIPEVLELDSEKERLLAAWNYIVLRFTNDEIKNNLSWVIQKNYTRISQLKGM